MPPLRLLLWLPVLFMTGCSWLPYAIDNVANGFEDYFHERRFHSECEKLADQAWKQTGSVMAGTGKTCEYEKGFRQGFIDYLDSNGTGEPPATPPHRLRTSILRSPQEQQAIEDWFAGFRDGAATAKQGGWRERIAIPISLPPRNTEESFGEQIIPRAGPAKTEGPIVGTAVFDQPSTHKSNASVATAK